MPSFHMDSTACTAFLEKLLFNNVKQEAFSWVENKKQGWLKEFNVHSLYLAFGSVPRQVGVIEVKITAEEEKQALAIRPGWQPAFWRADMLTRAIFLLSLSHLVEEDFLKTILTIFDTADVGELEALYAAFPLLPFSAAFQRKCAEGISSNITSAFERIAFHNPYPSEYLNEESWNQMVIKTMFIGKNINDIYGLENRRNIDLSRIATGLAHERWAAGRLVRPELWRLLVPFVNEESMPDIKRLLVSALPFEQEAGALLCTESNYEAAKALLENEFSSIKNQVLKEGTTWESLSYKYPFSI